MSIGKLTTTLTGETFREAVERYKSKNGGWPTNLSGDATPYFGCQITWAEADRLLRDALDTLTLEAFCNTLEAFKGEPSDMREAVIGAETDFVSYGLRGTGITVRIPSPADAMLVRAAELSDGTWSVELRMQEGWRTYSTGFTWEEAEGAARVLSVRHQIERRAPSFQPKPESATPTP